MTSAAGAPGYFVNPFNLHELFTLPTSSLPLFFFTAARNGERLFIERGLGADIVLLAMVLIVFGTDRFLSSSEVASR